MSQRSNLWSENINLNTCVTPQLAGAIKFVLDQIPPPEERKLWMQRGKP